MAELLGVRAVFRTFAASRVKAGWGANRIYRAAVGQGIGVRKQWGLGEIRKYTGLFKNEKLVSAVASDAMAPRYSFVEHEFTRDRRYLFTGSANFLDVETGEESTRTVSFYNDRMMSQDEVQSHYEDELEKPEYEDAPTLTGFKLRSVEHNRGWAY